MSFDEQWWDYGEYDGSSCNHCGRERVMICDAPDGSKRRVCEKCAWDQELGDYARLYCKDAACAGGETEIGL